MNRLLCIAIIISVVMFSCDVSNHNRNIEEGPVVIAGKIIFQEEHSKSITLNYSGGTNSREVQTILVDSSGFFQFDIDVLHPQDALIYYEDGMAHLFIGPSDSIFLEINADKFKGSRFPQFSISGSNARVSKEMLAYENYRTLEDFVPDIGDKSTTNYVEDIRQHILMEDSVLKAYCLEMNPSAQFKTWAKKEIIYKNANYLIDFKFHHIIHKTIYKGELFNTDIFPVDDDEAIISAMYGVHLWEYAKDKYIDRDPAVAALIESDSLYEAYELCLLNIRNGEKAGISRDIMSYRILSSLADISFEDFAKLWDSDLSFISTKELVTELQVRKEFIESQNNFSISLIDPESKEEKEILGDFFTELQKRHEGKVMYLDIWATWCGPCRSEIPHALEIEEHFHDRPIVFVNLCMNSSKAEWKKTLDNRHIGGENYYFDRTQSDLIRSRLRFKGFPTYMIIDKQGNIVSENAPRPSSGARLTQELERYIKE